MVVLRRKTLDGDAELQIGWPTWDPKGKEGELAVRYAYKRKGDGKVSRSSPEVSFGMLHQMVGFVAEALGDMLGNIKPSETK